MKKRTTFNFIVDLFSFISFAILILSGFAIKYMPHGGGHGRGYHGGQGSAEGPSLFLNITRHKWGDIHFIVSIVFIALVLVHLVMHWNWIVCYIKSLFSTSGESR